MKINLLILLFVISNITLGQSLVVTLNNGSTESFPVSDIQSIKFGEADMILYELNGTNNMWAIDSINYYAFSGSAGINDNIVIEEKIDIYPNPTSDMLTINYQTNSSDEISISIIDANGKLVANLFKGQHNQSTIVKWSSKGGSYIQSGMYFCKITTSNKIITKPIVIQ